MQTEEYESFKSLLGELFGAIDKPLTDGKIGGFWKGLAKMSLLEFTRTQELMLGEFEHHAAPKTLSVHDIWNAKRKLRAAQVRPEEVLQEKPWRGDQWDIAANRHLMGLCMRRAMRREGGFTEAQTRPLVHGKNVWAQTMRETAENGAVDVETQLGFWKFHVEAVVGNIDRAD